MAKNYIQYATIFWVYLIIKILEAYKYLLKNFKFFTLKFFNIIYEVCINYKPKNPTTAMMSASIWDIFIRYSMIEAEWQF